MLPDLLNKKTRNILLISFVVVFVVLIFSTLYFYRQYTALKSTPQSIAQEELKKVLARVNQLIVLPPNEQPTLATVADPEKLKDQPFFANAKAGFKVLIYTNAKKAILYDPVSNKIVEVAPINIGAPQANLPAPSQIEEQSTSSKGR